MSARERTPAGAAPRGGTRGRRAALRVALIVLALLAALLLANFLLARSTHRVLVADVPETTVKIPGGLQRVRMVDTEAMTRIRQQARDGHADLLILVAKPDSQGNIASPVEEGGDVVQWLRADRSPPKALVVSREGAKKHAETLSSRVRSIPVAAGGTLYETEQTPARPGPLPATLWGLALLATGGLLAWALLGPRTAAAAPAAPPAPVVPPTTAAPPGPAGPLPPASRPLPPGRAPGDSAGFPARSGKGVVVADWPGLPQGTAPAPAQIDLGRFPVRREPASWTPQCPHCGAFHPEQTSAGRSGAGYRCSHCGEAWQLSDGDSWPTVVVSPRHRRAD